MKRVVKSIAWFMIGGMIAVGYAQPKDLSQGQTPLHNTSSNKIPPQGSNALIDKEGHSLTIENVFVKPKKAVTGTVFKFTTRLSKPLIKGYQIKIHLAELGDWNVMKARDKTNRLFDFLALLSQMGEDIPVQIKLFNRKGEALNHGGMVVHYGVTDLENNVNTPPTLSIVNAKDNAFKNKPYMLILKVNDNEGNAKHVEINWGDGSKKEIKMLEDDAPVTFVHHYKKSGDFVLSATAIDLQDAPSKVLTKKIMVKNN